MQRAKDPELCLRPHHLLDIVTHFGAGAPFTPHPYGHAVHSVAEDVLAHTGRHIRFVVEADDICTPCVHSIAGRCDDVVPILGPTASKQEYNDDLDRRVLACLGMSEGVVMTVGEYLARVREHLDTLTAACAHPGEDRSRRLTELRRGLEKLGA